MIEDYKQCYPDRKGQELTEEILKDLLLDHGYIRGLCREQIIIRRSPSGKPFLDPETSAKAGADLVFSLSHTAGLFGCVIASRKETEDIGLDLQYSRARSARKLARRYYAEEENRYLQESCGPQEDAQAGDHPGSDAECEREYEARFFRLWTRKEAFSKYTGAGLTQILEKESVLDRKDVDFLDLDLGNGLYGCICSSIHTGG